MTFEGFSTGLGQGPLRGFPPNCHPVQRSLGSLQEMFRGLGFRVSGFRGLGFRGLGV